ncbi:efflux RND transporter periplasmic adaptor subunit [Hymenobacter canadensis]|uniref:HlyD family efflux transporter periplasmic adaptor subunit n=1 Tax=Hymenobacter canadensis TaxID=2999067 RepID=A0ABY7LW57_9BACT|nr:HlyD family efflux transporter periplasmic adaptor subunit [Hymenobacter canadensis]WBA44129.1 HlyD family efflux transporter periplasmic adaptor subunit [Hymenobacter canadensis]
MKRICYRLLLVLAVAGPAGCRPAPEVAPQRRDIVDAVFGSGHLENARQYTVVANAEGFLQAAYAAEGDTVPAGKVLFRLANAVQRSQVANAAVNLDYAKSNARQGSPQLAQLQLQLAQAQQKLLVDSANYARYGRLVKTQAVATADFENARLTYQTSQSNLRVLLKNRAELQNTLNLSVANAANQYTIQRENDRYYVLSSEQPGVLMNVRKKPGDYVRKGDALALLGAGGSLIKLDIAEDDIGRVKVGQPVLISLNSDKAQTYRATIRKVYPAFNTTDQSFVAEATFNPPPRGLLNGTQLQANIIVEEKKNALVIPSYALLNDAYVLLDGGKQKRAVGVGIRTLEWTEITRGLRATDRLTLPKAK